MKLNSERFSHALHQRGVSQAQLAQALGLSPAAVSNWKSTENGISIANLRQAEKFLGVPQDWLLGIDPAEPAPKATLNETEVPYLGRVIPPESAAVLTLSWHGFTREIALSRDPQRIGRNVLQALEDIDLLHRNSSSRPPAAPVASEPVLRPVVSPQTDLKATERRLLDAVFGIRRPEEETPGGHLARPKPPTWKDVTKHLQALSRSDPNFPSEETLSDPAFDLFRQELIAHGLLKPSGEVIDEADLPPIPAAPTAHKGPQTPDVPPASSEQ